MLAELGEIFDNAVVYDSDCIVAGGVRMGVALTWSAVRCPTSMSDATGAFIIEILDRFGKSRDFSDTVYYGELFVGSVLKCDAGGIIAAIFQTLKTLDENVLCALVTSKANDTAHVNSNHKLLSVNIAKGAIFHANVVYCSGLDSDRFMWY